MVYGNVNRGVRESALAGEIDRSLMPTRRQADGQAVTSFMSDNGN
jgi:hypothetical protein